MALQPYELFKCYFSVVEVHDQLVYYIVSEELSVHYDLFMLQRIFSEPCEEGDWIFDKSLSKPKISALQHRCLRFNLLAKKKKKAFIDDCEQSHDKGWNKNDSFQSSKSTN